MSNFSLADIRAAADKKYGSTNIDLADGTPVELRNPLKLSKDERKKLANFQEDVDGEDADQADALEDAIRLVARDKGLAERLVEEIDHDLTVLVEVFELYGNETQAGEASPSQD